MSKNISKINSLAIGSFDGIHLAHRELIKNADMVLVIERGSGYLTPGYKRSLYCDKLMTFYIFDKIAHLTPSQFVSKLKSDFPDLKKIVVGYDFKFGIDKSGDANTLKEIFDADTLIIDEFKLNNISIHSHIIKKYIQDQNIKLANKMLGRRYRIDGKIIQGQGLGGKELVPTLNLNTEDYLLPHGVYATKTKIGDVWFDSISFIGHRVSTDGSFAVESHILDQNIGKVNGDIWIEFVDFIRSNQKFDSIASLKEQIDIDITQAKRILSNEG